MATQRNDLTPIDHTSEQELSDFVTQDLLFWDNIRLLGLLVLAAEEPLDIEKYLALAKLYEVDQARSDSNARRRR